MQVGQEHRKIGLAQYPTHLKSIEVAGWKQRVEVVRVNEPEISWTGIFPARSIEVEKRPDGSYWAKCELWQEETFFVNMANVETYRE